MYTRYENVPGLHAALLQVCMQAVLLSCVDRCCLMPRVLNGHLVQDSNCRVATATLLMQLQLQWELRALNTSFYSAI